MQYLKVLEAKHECIIQVGNGDVEDFNAFVPQQDFGTHSFDLPNVAFTPGSE